MAKGFLKITAFTALILIHSAIALAGTNTATKTGAWETGSNWSTGAAPVATDNVIVPSGFTMTASVAGDLCASLTVNAGGTVYVTGTLSIGGSLTNAGTFNSYAGGTVTFNGAANSVISGGGSYSIAGTTGMNMGSAATTLDVQDANFILGITLSGKYYFTFTRGTWIMDNAGTLGDAYNSGSANALTIPYGVVIEAKLGQMNLAKNGTTGNVILSGELWLNGGNILVQLGQAKNSGNDFQYSVNGGTPELNMVSGTLEIGAGFNPLANTDYINFQMSGGTLVVAQNGYSDSYTFYLQDNIGGETVMSGGTIILQDACNAAKQDLDMGGAKVASTLYSVTGGTVQLGYVNTQAGSSFFGIQAQPATNYPNILFQSGVAKTVGGNNTGQVNMLSLYINSNMTFDATKFTTTNIMSANGTYSFDNEGTYTTGNNTMEFSGSVNQPITSTALANINFYNLKIANTSGNVTLGVNATVNNQLSFTSGLLDASKKTLTIANGTAVTGASTSTYVIVGNGVTTTGYLRINSMPTSTNTLFPIGTGTYYLPALVNPGTNAGSSYSTYVFTGATMNAQENGTPMSATTLANMLNAIWNIARNAGTGSASLTLDWNAAAVPLEGSVFWTAGTGIGISQYTGAGGWLVASGTGNVATYTANSSFSSFTQFAVTDNLFVLPVEVYNFNAILNSNKTVGLSWTASDEMEISQFDVERSTDGTNFTTIGTVQANGAETNYTFTDLQPASVNYYRLMTSTTEGSTVYSPIRTIDLSATAAISVYPIPATSTMNVSLVNAGSGTTIRLISISGQILQSSVAAGGTQVISMDISRYPTGMYIVQVVGQNSVLQTIPMTKL
jgi:hypothetical protein